MDKESEFFTVEEIARKLRVVPETVRRYTRTGELRAVKLGGRILRIDSKDFGDFVEKMKERSQKGK